jgi:hypothetical protein
MSRWLDPRNGYATGLRAVTDKAGPQWAEATKRGRYIYARVGADGQGELLDSLPAGMTLQEASNGVRIGRDLSGRVVVALPPSFHGLMAPLERIDAVHDDAVRAAMGALAEVLA